MKLYLRKADLEKVIHAFITSLLDRCNTVYAGIGQSELHCLQLVQYAAAHLLSDKKKCEHITPALSSLHWLPVKPRIGLKILLFVFKCLNRLAPWVPVRPYQTASALRSANLMDLEVPRSNQRSRGDQAFSVAAPTHWNTLPLAVRSANSMSTFKSLLKTDLFSVYLLYVLEIISLCTDITGVRALLLLSWLFDFAAT